MSDGIDVEKLETEVERLRHDVVDLIYERDAVRVKLSQLVLKVGGTGIGQVYGLSNCWACKGLTNDYYFVGKTRLCEECFDDFPTSVEVTSAKLAALREAAQKLGLQCVNTGMYGPMRISPGQCKCSTCEFKKVLQESSDE